MLRLFDAVVFSVTILMAWALISRLSEDRKVSLFTFLFAIITIVITFLKCYNII